MNCPFCNGEMEHGFVTSGAALTWRKRKKKVTFNPYPDKKQGEFVFSYNPFGGAAAEGYICKNCKKILIGYEEEME
jgi:sarcosine oxidase delta subunit